MGLGLRQGVLNREGTQASVWAVRVLYPVLSPEHTQVYTTGKTHGTKEPKNHVSVYVNDIRPRNVFLKPHPISKQ